MQPVRFVFQREVGRGLAGGGGSLGGEGGECQGAGGDEMQQRQSQPSATLMDEEGTAGKAYGARTTPHMYIVNPQGQLIYAGGIDSIPSSNAEDIKKATNYVRQGLGEALAGKPLTAATTRPYGCSIKYKG